MHDFTSYDLIIDARSPGEYEEDHIPGAINMPVVNNEEHAVVGTLHRTDKMGAYRIGAVYALKNIARHLDEDMPQYDRQSRMLVYCFRGGKRSQLWLTILESVGYRVEKMDGGWKNYRRWVNEQLSTVPPQYHYKILCGPTGCGKTRLLYALQAAGAQVLDLEELANHRGSVLGEVPGEKQPTQKYFDSLLLNKLSAFDPKKPIWVEAESKKIGNVQLPDALLETMRNNQTSQTIMIETALEQRVQLSREDYPHFEEDHVLMFKRLAFLKPLVGNKEFAAWEALAEQNAIPTLLEQLMHNHYDPTYRKSILRNYPKIDASPSIALSDLSPAGLLTVAKNMCAKFS